MPTTSNWSLPYPGTNEAPNGPAQIGALADAVDAALESRKSVYARKTGDTSRTNNTFSDDPHLSVSVVANAVYAVRCGLFYVSTSTTAGDFKAQFVAPASADLKASVHGLSASATTIADDLAACITLTTAVSVGVVSTADPFNPLEFSGLLVTAGTAGTFKVQWAQNTTHATATTLKTNSYLLLNRLG